MSGMVHITSTSQGPWSELDREWFKKHKARQWYIRDFTAGEEMMIARYWKELYDAIMAHWKQDPSIPERASMRVVVLQMRPGERMRLPLLDWPGRDKDNLWMLMSRDGEIRLSEIPIADFLADTRQMRAEDGWQQTPETEDPSGDFCNLCGKEFVTTQVNLHVRVNGVPKLACSECGVKGPAKMKIEGIGLFIAKADLLDPKRLEVAKASMVEIVKELKKAGVVGRRSH